MQAYTSCTELQARELLRRCMYLDPSIYSKTKPVPPYTRPPEWFEGANIGINFLLEPVEDLNVLAAKKTSGQREFFVQIALQDVPNKLVDSGFINVTLVLINTRGRRVKWTIDKVEDFIVKATFPVQFAVNINIGYAQFMAKKWTVARSNKLAADFAETSAIALTEQADIYREKAALIVNENSNRTFDYLMYAAALDEAALLQTDIETNNF